MTLHVGDIVEINTVGQYSYQAEDSEFTEGTITSVIDDNPIYYEVDFENGYSNGYCEKDLILIRKGGPNWKRIMGGEE